MTIFSVRLVALGRKLGFVSCGGFRLQHFHHLIGCGVGGIFLEKAGKRGFGFLNMKESSFKFGVILDTSIEKSNILTIPGGGRNPEYVFRRTAFAAEELTADSGCAGFARRFSGLTDCSPKIQIIFKQGLTSNRPVTIL